MPGDHGIDATMSDTTPTIADAMEPSAEQLATEPATEPATINPSVIPLRVNGDAGSAPASLYDPTESPQSPNTGNRAASLEVTRKMDSPSYDDRYEEAETAQQRKKLKVMRQKGLPISSLKTGLCYDVRMRYHATVDEEDMHPEDPRRIYEIYKALCEAGLVDDPDFTGVPKVHDLMMRIPVREVTREEALLVHDVPHWDFLKSTTEMDIETLQRLTFEGDSVYFNRESFFCSKLSCGGAIETCRAVVKGIVKNAIAVIRPPGHHAEPYKAMGFCLFNNVCVAARVMQRDFPACKKVLILDWDVHHGNGTQTAFYEDPSVLYMSIHRYQNGKFYPQSTAGNWDKCGAGEGIGRNVNVPWSCAGMGDGDYLYAFQHVIMPIAQEFKPDLVIVSAGFDAAAGDLLGGCYVTPAGYAHMTHMLLSLANGRVVVCLEGGYNLNSISTSALAVAKVLMGEPCPPAQELNDGDVARRAAAVVVHQCIKIQSRYWRCMKPADYFRDYNNMNVKINKLGDVIRAYQAKHLYSRHKMTSLLIYQEVISEAFEDQVLGSPDFYNKKVLLLVIHDPPAVCASPDPESNRIALHNAYLVDSANVYIDWAISRGFGVVDANVPAITDEAKRFELATQLCSYLWDNYIEIAESNHIFLIGIGEALTGLINLLSERAESCKRWVSGCVCFVDRSLRAVPSDQSLDLAEWYYDNSLVFVYSGHPVWEKPKKRGKRFGRLIHSKEKNMHEAMASEEVLEKFKTWVLDRIVEAE